MTSNYMDDPEHEVCAALMLGELRLEDLLYQAKKSSRIAPLQMVRADAICGQDHIRMAAMHAKRAQAEGRAHADRPEVDYLRYLAGERQIGRALQKLGLDEISPASIVIALGAKRHDALEHFFHALGHDMQPIPSPTTENLLAFGITQTQLDTTEPSQQADLILETMALVELGPQ